LTTSSSTTAPIWIAGSGRAEQLLIAQQVRVVLFDGRLADALRVQQVFGAVAGDDPGMDHRPLFAPRRPIGFRAGPILDAFVGEVAEDPPHGAVLPPLGVEPVGVLLEEHFHVAILGGRFLPHGAEQLLRLGGHGRGGPRLLGRRARQASMAPAQAHNIATPLHKRQFLQRD